MRILRTIAGLREALEPFEVGFTVGLVPTMGAFHGGHLALFRAARAECDAVVASLFVNPAQFARGEERSYPRDETTDGRLAEEEGVDFLFAPGAEEMYPPGYQTWVEVEELSRGLEGRFRPGHFRGVATVCLKLFTIVRPQIAYFGAKDAQQAAVVSRLVRDLALPLELRVLPTERDEDGLALSSRNVLLGSAERKAAAGLPRALAAGAEAAALAEDPAAAAMAVLEAEPLLQPDYVEVADLDGLRVLAAAVRVGSTRLIDNVTLRGTPA